MTFLELVQTLHYEARLPGSPPAAVTGQNGRAADLVRWTAQAYEDIQRERDGKWKWLRGEFELDTVASQAAYAYTDCTDALTASPITRFRAWDLDSRQPPFIYRVSEGLDTERELPIADWEYYRRMYRRGVHEESYPLCIAAGPDDKLYFGPTPVDVFHVTGNYWKSNQSLVADQDEPEMPADFHMLVVYTALTKYAYSVVAQEALARAQHEGTRLYDALSLNQAYSRFSISIADALA